jgi:hypothetical protein
MKDWVGSDQTSLTVMKESSRGRGITLKEHVMTDLGKDDPSHGETFSWWKGEHIF